MKKAEFSYLVDMGLIITFFISFISGILKFKEVTLFFANNGIYFSNYWLNYIHDRIGIVFGIIILFHLIIHFKKIKINTKKYFNF